MSKPNNLSLAFPYLMVRDVAESIDFYQQAFGFEKLAPEMMKDGIPVHAELSYRGQSILMGYENSDDCCAKTPATSGHECPINMYLYCDDVDSFCRAAEVAGGLIVKQPEDTFWGDRMCSIKCPNGYLWNFATQIAK